MDQKKTNAPHFIFNVKGIDGGILTVKVQGVYVHGRKVYLFLCPESFIPSDANLALDTTMRVLNDPDLAPLPPTLFTQVDGGSENNNSWMVALCWLLVKKRVFKRVEVRVRFERVCVCGLCVMCVCASVCNSSTN